MAPSKQPYQAVLGDEIHGDGDRDGDGDKIPLRPYVDAADSDDEVDDDDPVNDVYQSFKPRHRRAVPSVDDQHASQGRSRRPWQRLCCYGRFSNTTLVIFALFAGVVVTLLGGGGLYVYKAAPVDGQSPPWYPTPNGGTVEAWQESYAKAKDMVERMTLVEKVNITTGTG